MKRVSILDCFTPPQGFIGDFGWICGFTAHTEILKEMGARFTQAARRRRPSLVVFLHPPERLFPYLNGVFVPYCLDNKRWRGSLLHAKVALLHFRGPSGSMLRLIVSTGNWTYEPMTTSLDLFWITEWYADRSDHQAVVDIRAAAEMFLWLRDFFDMSAATVAIGGSTAEAGLLSALESLPAIRKPPPSRFIDTRRVALQPQILTALARHKVSRQRLIMGSGYFETGEMAEAGVLTGFVDALVNHQLTAPTPKVDVVLNADSCQGLATQAAQLIERGWSFRPPRSRELQGAKLHAKFLFGAGGRVKCTEPWCYIGSGNLSRIGFTKSLESGGNLEAGVVFFPDEPLLWQGEGEQAISARLPVNLEILIAPSSFRDGDPFHLPGTPAMVPPVSYLYWQAGKLMLPEGAPDCSDLTVRMDDGSWEKLPVAMANPPVVAVLGPMMAEVPVLTEQGFMLTPPGPKRVEDVLYELTLFPRETADERDFEIAGELIGEEDAPVPMTLNGEYPLRRMMRLIVRLTERQVQVEPESWELWVNRLNDALTSITKPEHEMIDAIRSYGVDPLGALLHKPFLPTALRAADVGRLEVVLRAIRGRWGLEGLLPLFEDWAEA